MFHAYAFAGYRYIHRLESVFFLIDAGKLEAGL
jgi:hypothetical protein